MGEERRPFAGASPADRGATKVAVVSLGCRTNQEEVECLLGTLRDLGCESVPLGSEPDWVVVNTCSVTAAGESDARQMIRRAVREHGRARVLVTGCFAQRDPEGAARLGAHVVVGNGEKWRIPEILIGADLGAMGVAPGGVLAKSCASILFRPDPTIGRFLRHGRRGSGYRTRAAVKIQDGCEERCTYCIIPALRGRGTSRPTEEVLEEARVLVQSGHAEITLTGIHTASYDFGGTRLAGLLSGLLAIEGLRRIRLNSLEPQWVDPDLISVLASSSRFCRHVHLPLQSGDDGVLKRMGRGYTAAQYGDLVGRIRERIPGVAIGTDIIAGFPGEDEAAAERTLALVEDLRPAYLHVFPYSPRPGTASLRFHDRIPPAVARQRSRRLAALDRNLRSSFLDACEGDVHEILVEDKKDPEGWPQGTTDNAIRVRIGADAPAGRWIGVRLRRSHSDRWMFGDPV